MYWYVLLAVVAISFVSNEAYAQVNIDVPTSQPCFLNMTAGVDMWKNCGASDDYMDFALGGFEWVTGGYFSMIIVTIFVIMAYVKYHTVLYPILIGIFYLPVSYTFFPETFMTSALILTAVGFSSAIIYMVIRQTKD